MNDRIQRPPLEKKSPYRRASYAAAVAIAAIVLAPLVFGLNIFSLTLSWAVENWPRLLIIAGVAVWMGKSRLG